MCFTVPLSICCAGKPRAYRIFNIYIYIYWACQPDAYRTGCARFPRPANVSMDIIRRPRAGSYNQFAMESSTGCSIYSIDMCDCSYSKDIICIVVIIQRIEFRSSCNRSGSGVADGGFIWVHSVYRWRKSKMVSCAVCWTRLYSSVAFVVAVGVAYLVLVCTK